MVLFSQSLDYLKKSETYLTIWSDYLKNVNLNGFLVFYFNLSGISSRQDFFLYMSTLLIVIYIFSSKKNHYKIIIISSIEIQMLLAIHISYRDFFLA